MSAFFRRQLRQSLVTTLALILGGSGFALTPAHAQAPKAEKQKEVTDGFFDVPARDPSEDGPEIGLFAYIVTAGLGGLAMFILCKSARRG